MNLLIPTWGLLGATLGAVINTHIRPLLQHNPTGPWKTPLTAALTGILFTATAALTPTTEARTAISAVITVGVPLAAIDLTELRLPTPLITAGLTTTITATLATGTWTAPTRAITAAFLVTALYLTLAHTTGGLGPGDIRLGALLATLTAWTTWTALATSLILSWTTLALQHTTHHDNTPIPAGPALILGTIITTLST
ncbi:prepilin peptidase [Actinokineospora pegani]|uniref:prepilin peptidase n=1 Tax=Actinokineospora pegani TaxID=2654637 RepID=UPI0012EA5BA0|nr:prepilin peptidase [Actinokineospora pegani]